jgi:hypothetical protein
MAFFVLSQQAAMQKLRIYKHQEHDPRQPPKPSIFQRAASYSLWMPMIVGVTSQVLIHCLKGTKHAGLISQLGSPTYFLYAAALTLGVFALLGIPRQGVRDILMPAAVGIAISGFLMGLYGSSLMERFEAALKKHEILVRARASSEQNGNTSDSDASTNTALAKQNSKGDATNELQQYMLPGQYKPVYRGPGDMALVTKAMEMHLAKQRSFFSAYNAAVLALTNPPVMNLKGVDRREQLMAKKELVNKYLAANEKLLGFTTKAETDLRQNLEKLNSGPDTIEAGLKDYHASMADQDFIQQQIRATDQRAGTAMLAMLNLLDANLGGWNFDADKNKVNFRDGALAVKYYDALNEMTAAKAEQAQLLSQLFRPTMAARPTAAAPSQKSSI